MLEKGCNTIMALGRGNAPVQVQKDGGPKHGVEENGGRVEEDEERVAEQVLGSKEVGIGCVYGLVPSTLSSKIHVAATVRNICRRGQIFHT